MSSSCYITPVIDFAGRRPSYNINDEEGTIHIPLGSRYKSLHQTYSVAKSIQDKINKNFEKFGDLSYVISYSDGHTVKIEPTESFISAMDMADSIRKNNISIKKAEEELLKRQIEGNWKINSEGDIIPFDDDYIASDDIDSDFDGLTLMNLKLSGRYDTVQKAVLHLLSEKGMVSKYNPRSKLLDQDRWYFTKDLGRENNVSRYNMFMSMNNLNKDMFIFGRSKSGVPYLIPNKKFNLKDSIEENNEKIHKDKYEAIIDFLSKKFGISRNRINYITKAEFARKFPRKYRENMTSAYSDGKFYFFTNNLTADITVEELLHPFVYTLAEYNSELFGNLVREAKKSYPLLHQKIQALYHDQHSYVKDQELVSQALARLFNNVYEKGEQKTLIEVVKDFVKWMLDSLNKIIEYYRNDKLTYISAEDINPYTSLEEIANLLNATDARFDVVFPEGTFYNMSDNPDSFNEVITNLLSDKRVEANVEKMLVQLPSAIKDIRKRLTSPINEIEKRELNSILKSMEELADEDKQSLLKSQIKGILTTVQLFNTLSNELNTVDRSDMDNNIKLLYYMSIYKTSTALDGFKGIMLELNDELKTQLRLVNNVHIREFNRLIESAIAAQDEMKHKIFKLVKSPLLEELVKSNEYTYKIPIDGFKNEIKLLEEEIQKTNSLQEKEKLQNKVSSLLKEIDKILEKAPTRENLEKVFNSEFRDANQLSYIFESSIANGHPLINTLQNIINNIYDRAGSNMLNSKNEAQTKSDEFSKASGRGLRDVEVRFRGIADDIMRIPVSLVFKDGSETELKLDSNGNPQFNYVDQNTLVQEVDNEYYTRYMELEMIKNHYGRMYSGDIHNNVKNSPNKILFEKAREDFENFKKENSEREYSDKFYEFRAMLDEKVGDRTIRQITGDVYDEIDRLKNEASRSDTASRIEIFQAIRDAEIKLKYFRSNYNEDGTEKDEDGKKIARILNEYYKLRYELGKDVLTPEGEAKYRFDRDTIENKKDQYSPSDYKRAMSELHQVKVLPEYFEAIADIVENINYLTNILSENIANSEVSKYIGDNKYKAIRKDVYNNIRDWVRPYRDGDGVIDGISITRQNSDLVKRVKEAQQYVEDIKYQTTKMWNLSIEESNEYALLKSNRERTIEEEKRFQELVEKKNVLRNFKTENIEVINQISSLFGELDNISVTTNTEYFQKIIDEKLLELKADEKSNQYILDFLDKNTKIDVDGIIYIKKDSKWYVQQKLGKKVKEVFMGDENDPSSTGHKEMVSILLGFHAKESLKLTDWWKDNHYITYRWSSKLGTYEPVEKAIYIWEHQEPNNPNFIEVSPSKKYYTYKVNDDNINENYNTSYRNIPKAEKGKYVNKKYQQTMSDKSLADFLTYLTNKYNKIQEIYPDFVKMGHVLPAIAKTSDENAVNITNNPIGSFKELFLTNTGKTDTDTSYLLGGGQENNKTVPMRFVGVMDTKHQTKDALVAILLFEYHASLYKSLNDSLPIFEASQLLAAKADTLESKNSVEKIGFADKIRKIFSLKVESKDNNLQIKKTEKTVLSKSVDNILNTFVYGQRLKPMVLNLGVFGNVDLTKVSTNVLGFAAKTIFIGNIISSINNSLSTRLQAIVNSGIKSNLYSLNNLKNAHILSRKYGYNLLSDWTKLGNKSMIGQILDKFSFLAENPSREITSKTSFTYLKNKTEFLTSPKQISEFEVLFIQFLTIADATPVKINGKTTKLSNFEEIFEIGKDGNLKYKDGVEFTNQQEDIFRGMFQSMARKLQGAYRVTEISSIETNWVGKSALFLRRYFVAMATNRFAGERWNSQEMEVQIGYQRETFRNLIKMFLDYQNLGMEHWSKMSDKEKSSFYKTMLEYGILITLIALLGLAGGDDDKKKLKENSWYHNMLLVILLRARSEMEQFTLKGTDDLIRIGKNPFIAFTTIGNIWKITTLGSQTILGNDSAYYKQNTGLHKKGDSKLVALFFKILGYTGATFHPEEYYINFKNAQNR